MELSLYRVADYEDSFTLTGKFQNYQVSLDQKDQDGWKGVARTLADYIGRDGIEADAVAKSGSDRSARFEDLSRGLYLVSAKEIEVQENGRPGFTLRRSLWSHFRIPCRKIRIT